MRRSDGSTRRDDEILTSGSKKRMNGKLSAFIKLKRIADDPRRSIDFYVGVLGPRRSIRTFDSPSNSMWVGK